MENKYSYSVQILRAEQILRADARRRRSGGCRAFRTVEEGSVTPIHMFYREWAVVVEIERYPDVLVSDWRWEPHALSGWAARQ